MSKMRIFGITFLLFGAVLFPMVIYYSNAPGYSEESSGNASLVWLGVSVILWSALLYQLFYWLVTGRVIVVRRLSNLMKNGELKDAKIIRSTLINPEFAGVDRYRLNLELQNFAGATINDTMDINDSRPFLRNFDAGKTIKVRIDKTLKNVPYLQIEGAHYKKQPVSGPLTGALIWALCVTIVAGYYMYSYQHENNCAGWSFLVWYHPLIICPLILLALTYLFRTKRLKYDHLQYKYYGFKTQAQVIKTSKSGMDINYDPEVRFDLRYTGRNGKTVNASVTKTIGVFEAAMLQQKTMDIVYLENDPKNIRLASDLE
ncbi:MAG: hypothetical protein ACXVJD_04755 [Mucilaginibacter sp.]